MKFDLEWMLQHVDTAADADTLATRLTDCGFLVETRDVVGETEVWDVEATTNRPDVMNHRGLARELAVAVGGRLKALDATVPEGDEQASSLVKIEIEDADLCSRYVGRVICGVHMVASPEWLQARLERCGVRPINAVVDATNYVLLETGQPLHAFDLAKLADRRIAVRRARDGENLMTLDGEERRLQCDDLVIADGEGPVALAGVMGGADSEIDETTVDIVLESAHFAPLPVRRTTRRLGMHTEASHRFERGADPEMAPIAADLAARLIVELAGGTVCRGRIDVYPRPWQATELTMSVAGVSRFAGLEISPDDVMRILDGLEFTVRRDGDTVVCAAPSFRVDIERVPDLYEEVIRHVGYGPIPAVLPVLRTTPGRRHNNWELVDRGRRAAVACGLDEAVTYAFIDAEADARVQSWPLCPGPPVALANPLSETQTTMRRSLLPGLLAAARDNLNQGERSIRLFEEGRVFASGDDGACREPERLALVLVGPAHDGDELGFAELKGTVEAILKDTAMPEVSWRRGGSPLLDEAEGALLVDGSGRTLGVAGRLGAAEASRWNLKQAVYVAEIDLQAAAERPPLPRFRELPRFPAVAADMTVEHGDDLTYTELAKTVQTMAGELVNEISMVARFTGGGLPAGVVRTTLRMVYRHPERSLTQDEVNAAQEKLRSNLAGKLGVRIS